jgi:7-cyano-7-deazaguanine synthase in queuosine biosynthesis
MTDVVLFGGGLDSTAVVHKLGGSCVLFHIDYGQAAAVEETRFALTLAADMSCEVRLDRLPDLIAPNTSINGKADNPVTNEVPGRNCLLISFAVQRLLAEFEVVRLFLGFHAQPIGTPFVDTLREFWEPLDTAIRFSTRGRASLFAPYADTPRDEVLMRLFNASPTHFQLAHTCYRNVRGGCGECAKCVFKKEWLQRHAPNNQTV